MFVHLHTHSHYSFLEGLASPSELAQAAFDHGMPALALTDRHILTGAIEFYEICQALGVRPVLGMELDVAPPPELSWASTPGGSGYAPLVLLAMDETGWASLCRLSSALPGGPEAGQHLPFERLAQEAGGLLCLSGGRRSLAAAWAAAGQEKAARTCLGLLSEVFPGRLYVELQNLAQADRDWLAPLSSLAGRLGLPVIASHEVYYLAQDQGPLQRLATAIRLNRPLNGLPASAPAPAGAYFAGQAELEARFAEFPQALKAAEEAAGRCRLELPLGQPHYPEVNLPEGVSPAGQLRLQVLAGARQLYASRQPYEAQMHGDAQSIPAPLPPEIQARLDHELEVIGRLGYDSLFLIMQEILQFARQAGVPVSSRGSAASSLVAHCLGITSPDPLRLNLYFERFVNPARATPPDIDTDLCSRRRDEVIRFVYRRFGQDRVAMVCTINRFRKRSALRETAKAHGLKPAEVKTLVDSLPHFWGPPFLEPAGEGPYADLDEEYSSERYRAIFRQAAALIGLPHHLSIHPGGMVITPGPLNDLVPTQMASKGVVITQFDLDSVERLGLIKIDLLGIRGLTVLGDVAAALYSGGTDAAVGNRPAPAAPAAALHQSAAPYSTPAVGGPSEALHESPTPYAAARAGRGSPIDVLDGIPETDPQVAELVRTGRTIGCFQIESPGMRATLKEIQARSVDDLMIALALYRPGPLTGGLKDAFVRRHLGQEAPAYLHPALRPLLEDTYGVILYQEQVLRIAHELGGLSLADADLLRRAMSHFDPGKQMQTLKEKFTAGALARHGVPEPASERIWDQMAAFAGYGFPKAHAASYAQVAWRAAWCKVHAPAVFMAAVLANWGGYYSQGVYLTEARRMGLALKPPHVNYARPEFSVSVLDGQPVLFMGLGQVRELTRRTQERILRRRPFRSLDDFLARAGPRPVEAVHLARAGALEGLGGSIPQLLRRLQPGGWQGGQLPLFDLEALGGQADGEDWTLAEKVAAQEEVLGNGVDAHRLELFAERIRAAGALTSVEAASRIGQHVLLAGMRQTWRRSRSSRREPVYFMTLEDLEGMLDVVISAQVYRQSRSALAGPGPYLLEGLVEANFSNGEPFVRAEKIAPI